MSTLASDLQTDVLVIGGGGAGCRAAMSASDAGALVTMVEKGHLGRSGATYDPFTNGKGITVAAAGFSASDDPELHFQKAIEAARGLANPTLARLVAYEAPARFRELLDAGFPFRTNQLQACFGRGMVGAVIDQPDLARHFRSEIKRRPIHLLEKTMAVRLLTDGQRCVGAVCLSEAGELLAIRAQATILATGGASSIFRYNFAGPELTGDGHVMALESGAALANMEFYQAILGITSPTPTFFPQWLLAGRPELTNAQGQPFLAGYLSAGTDAQHLLYERSFHGPFTSSLPSGQVDLAITKEILAGQGTATASDPRILAGVYCHFSGLPRHVRRQLDGAVGRPVLAWLRARGVDLEAGPVPVAPFAHAFNGGIVIDEYGRTDVPGLYACGEVAAGPHGANRVGGHMFAVLLVLGHRAGRHAAEASLGLSRPPASSEEVATAQQLVEGLRQKGRVSRSIAVRRTIQQAMSPIMILKDADTLQAALFQLGGIGDTALQAMGGRSPAQLRAAMGTRNLYQVAILVAKSAKLRCESRGPHFRTDHPEEVPSAPWDRSLIWEAGAGVPVPSWGSLAQRGRP